MYNCVHVTVHNQGISGYNLIHALSRTYECTDMLLGCYMFFSVLPQDENY